MQRTRITTPYVRRGAVLKRPDFQSNPTGECDGGDGASQWRRSSIVMYQPPWVTVENPTHHRRSVASPFLPLLSAAPKRKNILELACFFLLSSAFLVILLLWKMIQLVFLLANSSQGVELQISSDVTPPQGPTDVAPPCAWPPIYRGLPHPHLDGDRPPWQQAKQRRY
jgi:hypothetical protein